MSCGNTNDSGAGGERPSVTGAFYFGDGLGMRQHLEIYADGTFKISASGCEGASGSVHGKVHQDGNRMRLIPDKSIRTDMFNFAYSTLFPVNWGKRLYLVAPESMQGFCNDINMGIEPRKKLGGPPDAFMREGDQDKPVEGLPGLPGKWKEYILAKPVHGKITKLKGQYSAEVDLGSADGLRKGMVLLAKEGLLPLDIKSTTAHNAQVSWKDAAESMKEVSGKDEYTETVGDQVTSRMEEARDR